MSTIDRSIVLQILADNGRYADDDIPNSIWRYKNQWGAFAYSVCYSQAAAFSLCKSPHVCAPVLLWDKRGLTDDGRAELVTEDIDVQTETNKLKALVVDALKAEEVFELDELEAHAEKLHPDDRDQT